MEKGLQEKTGKSLNEWVQLVRAENFEKHGQIMNWLKSDYGFTHGYANFVALKARVSDAASYSDNDLLKMQYEGKENLKSIYDNLKAEILKFGNDIQFVPKKANVSVRRKKQFALIQPSTKKRVDLGLKLKNIEKSGKLQGSGSFGSMCTHSVKLEAVGEIDSEIVNWIKLAYDNAN